MLRVVNAHADYRRFCASPGSVLRVSAGPARLRDDLRAEPGDDTADRARMDRLVPPSPVPSPSPAAAPPPLEARRPPSQEQWKQAIIDEVQRSCDAYPKDPICHFRDQPLQ